MKGLLKTIDNRIYMAKTEDGRITYVDLRDKGEKTGLSPMEMLLFAAAACSMIDVQVILEKKRYKVEELRVVVEGRRRDDYPKIWEWIRYHYIVKGDGIKKEDVEKAIQLSLSKYCSATITLVRAGAELEWSFEVVE